MSDATRLHLLVDLSRSGAGGRAEASVLESIRSQDGPGPLITEATCLLAKRWRGARPAQQDESWRLFRGRDGVELGNEALDRAARDGAELLVMLAPVIPTSEAIGVMRAVMLSDPYFGFVLPRISEDAAGGGLRRLVEGVGDPEIETLPRRVLGHVPETYILLEHLTACFLIRRELVSNFGPLDTGYRTLAGALLHFMSRGRRSGFRCVAANRAVIRSPYPARRAELTPPEHDVRRLREAHPDVDRSRRELERHPLHAHESLLARSVSPDPALRRTLLLDMTNLTSVFNGTCYAMLGLAGGLFELGPDWRVTVMARPDAAGFHRLRSRFRGWEVVPPDSAARHTVAIRLSQPWLMEQMVRLHELALFNIYMVLDSISWDTFHASPDHLDELWRFLARRADGLLYDSAFTRARFRARFGVPPTVGECVTHLSFHPEEYAPGARGRNGGGGGSLLVVGNSYDHKWLPATVETLATAFPFLPITALGYRNDAYPHVTGIESGAIPEREIDRLYEQARLVVFPSFYEGFGFPILKGLSCGKTVIARRSDLVEELAANYRGGGRLVVFEEPRGLVEAVGRVLHGRSLDVLRLGSALAPGAEPPRWRDAARRLIEFAERVTRRAGETDWMERDADIRRLDAAP